MYWCSFVIMYLRHVSGQNPSDSAMSLHTMDEQTGVGYLWLIVTMNQLEEGGRQI